ncbi:carbohydrate ABC transporter permease [Puniceicoccales bacterium CK1056]|uniref:Carbohydrate ABC transporter permease n=1 Tax=Oceanipulchritudo coccoides TaxID=2706888 RepID=A0A6B2M4D9_9BACT|nr:carbohydrate ABC transporter permease [Oceanipulchritudo coccoides]NDV63089.1 carbohydrate ABC transporter permease [Oceanipulchritudo coccoides]
MDRLATNPAIKSSDFRRFGLILTYGALITFGILTLIPITWLLVGSFKTNEDFFGHLFLPLGEGLFGVAWDRLTLAHYWKLFSELEFGNYVMNSIFLASVTSALATFVAALGGYALAKFRFKGRWLITALVLAAIIIPGPLLIAPIYDLLYHLDLLNTYTGLILPAMGPAFGIFLFRQAMLNAVPIDMLEAARIDGCGEFRIFFSIVIPIVRPMIGAFLLITFLGTWNNFIGPQVILQDESKFPLSVAIAQLRGIYSTDYGMISAGTIVSIAPVMVIFLLLQKEFITGLTGGAVKG